MKAKQYTKVIDEKYIVPDTLGGGLIKFEAWELEGIVVKYNMVYINQNFYPNDNGRVVGYDNAHGFHHKHYFGEIVELENFVSYEAQVRQFREEIKEFVHD